MRQLIILLALFTTPATAQNICYDIWFTRNLHFDRAGFCFGSPLGQAIFDNTNCTGNDISLPPRAKAQVAEIKQLEALHGCKIDSNRTWLEIDDIDIRRRLHDLPIRDDLGSGCLGFLGGPVPLRSGYAQAAPVIGRLEPGDFVSFTFLSVNGWSYITTHPPTWGPVKSGGWVRPGVFPEKACSNWAG